MKHVAFILKEKAMYNDEIGLHITHIDDDGYLKFGQVGGWDPLVLIAQRVVVITREGKVPGVIGRVGTKFGEVGINIAGMTVSRSRRGGKALMVLTVDSQPPPELVEWLRGEGFDDARVLELGPMSV